MFSMVHASDASCEASKHASEMRKESLPANLPASARGAIPVMLQANLPALQALQRNANETSPCNHPHNPPDKYFD
jgi:hypothetical protein